MDNNPAATTSEMKMVADCPSAVTASRDPLIDIAEDQLKLVPSIDDQSIPTGMPQHNLDSDNELQLLASSNH